MKQRIALKLKLARPRSPEAQSCRSQLPVTGLAVCLSIAIQALEKEAEP